MEQTPETVGLKWLSSGQRVTERVQCGHWWREKCQGERCNEGWAWRSAGREKRSSIMSPIIITMCCFWVMNCSGEVNWGQVALENVFLIFIIPWAGFKARDRNPAAQLRSPAVTSRRLGSGICTTALGNTTKGYFSFPSIVTEVKFC